MPRSCAASRRRTTIRSGAPCRWCSNGTARIGAGATKEGLAEVESGFALYGALDTPPVFWSGLLAIRTVGCLMAGALDDAGRYLDEATAALWPGDPTEVDLEILRGDLLLARPDPEPGAAAAAFERAVALAEERGTRMSHLQALTRLAVLRRGTADEPTAIRGPGASPRRLHRRLRRRLCCWRRPRCSTREVLPGPCVPLRLTT